MPASVESGPADDLFFFHAPYTKGCSRACQQNENVVPKTLHHIGLGPSAASFPFWVAGSIHAVPCNRAMHNRMNHIGDGHETLNRVALGPKREGQDDAEVRIEDGFSPSRRGFLHCPTEPSDESCPTAVTFSLTISWERGTSAPVNRLPERRDVPLS